MLSPMEVKCLDRNSEYHGVKTEELMENAGEAVARLVSESYWKGKEYPLGTLVLCGLGNNGGDGLVGARHLAKSSLGKVTVMIVGEGVASRSDLFAKNYQRLRGMEDKVTIIENVDGKVV